MTTDREHRALGGLHALEQRVRDRAVPEGSPVAQLAVSVVAPGIPALKRVPLLGIVLFTVGLAVPFVLMAWAFSQRDQLVGFALNPRFLLAVVVVGVAAVVARLLAIAEVAHAFRRSRGIGGQTTAATLLVLLLGAPVLWVSFRANEARGVVADVFAGGGGPALYVPDDDTSGVDPDAVTNILLFGGDAGPGRWGMRTDTMILVSIHEASGRTALVSIPRNLTRLQFPSGTPLAAQFPNGFDDLANAVFTHVSGRPELVEHYGAGGLQAEPVALVQALGYSLDVEIDDFALVNMKGFADIVDAVGGVTLELSDRVPLPPSPPDEDPVPESVGPGTVGMDGALALAYVRTRSADSDYERMGRQRQLLAALGSQVSAGDALRGFATVTGALGDSMRTSLSSGEFDRLLDRLGDNSAIQESVGLTPPLITPGDPDYAQIRAIIDAVQLAVVTGQPSGYAS